MQRMSILPDIEYSAIRHSMVIPTPLTSCSLPEITTANSTIMISHVVDPPVDKSALKDKTLKFY